MRPTFHNIDYHQTMNSLPRSIESQTAPMMNLRVRRKVTIAKDVTLFELVHSEGAELPAFTAGAHIAVTTPNGLLRRYSLSNAPTELDRYVIAVKRDDAGEGGSISLVDNVHVGDTLQVAPPENYFPLAENAEHHLLIAGGIGITPILSMARDLYARGAHFRVVYCSRHPESTAFLDELAKPELAERVCVHHSYGDPARSFDLRSLLSSVQAGTHVYCCGPRRLMQAVRDLTSQWPASTVHFEDFGTSEHPQDNDGAKAFTVRLAKSGITVEVSKNMTILGALRSHGMPAPSSCESGTCGSCRTRLLAGEADHRDFVLDEDEQNEEIMICVSRARSDELVLDL
jgi:phthalate 4,5-dioxygenase reductase component